MPVITLTSDIGLQDYMVGAIKGELFQLCPGSWVFDISHQVAPFNFPQAAYLCRSAVAHFPPGSFHFILVNLFDKKQDHFLLAQHGGRYFCCADNGLLNMIIEAAPEKVVQLLPDRTAPKNTIAVTRLFAAAVNKVLAGTTLEDIGPLTTAYVQRNSPQPMISDQWMEGQIIYIDNFENVVVNITREQFEEQRKGRGFRIYVMRDEFISNISESYADVPEGSKLALFNTAGYLEIAINKGNAAGLFGLQSFDREQLKKETYYQNRLFYQTVRILFE